KIKKEAIELGSDKDITKDMLENEGGPVPRGKGFNQSATAEEVINNDLELCFPLVLIQTDGSLGLGVVTYIESRAELEKAYYLLRKELEYEHIIVVQYITGEEYRLYVIEDQVIAAYNRKPANITGDGKHTIGELIHLKNRERRKNSRLNSCLIEIDQEIIEFIESAGYTLESVLPEDEMIYLREKTNVS